MFVLGKTSTIYSGLISRKLSMASEFSIRESHYYTYQDEKRFYEWLESIPGVERVFGSPKGLTIRLADAGLDIDDWADLTALLIRYGIDMRILRDLVTPENEAWIKDRKRFWYVGIFGDDTDSQEGGSS
jgi:hypothetical protein